jgi:hypothetical protein
MASQHSNHTPNKKLTTYTDSDGGIYRVRRLPDGLLQVVRLICWPDAGLASLPGDLINPYVGKTPRRVAWLSSRSS